MKRFNVSVSDDNLQVIKAALGSLTSLDQRLEAVLRRFDALYHGYQQELMEKYEEHLPRLMSGCWDFENRPTWLSDWYSTQVEIADDHGIPLNELLTKDILLKLLHEAPWHEVCALEEFVSRLIVEKFDPTPDAVNFSSKEIRKLREGAGISQDEAAHYVGVSLEQWIKWESGEESVPECYHFAVNALSTPAAWREIQHMKLMCERGDNSLTSAR